MNNALQASQVWEAAVELAIADNSLSSLGRAFVRMVRPQAYADNLFRVSAASTTVKDVIEKHALSVMENKLHDILGRDIHIDISIDPTINEGENQIPVEEQAPASAQAFSSFEPSHGVPAQTQAEVHEQMREDTAPIPRVTPVDSPSPADTSLPEASASVSSTYFDSPKTATKALSAGLNPRHTFENFVVGESNRLANAASRAVSEAPGTVYNPLFMYSNSGLGKTHLMHAIGNYTLKLFPDKSVRYVSAEEFTNAFISAVRDRRQAEFKDEFRNVDILLIDDIQFIGGKDSTVEEFFHTFNALINANKQIVITSDVAPSLLNGFEERLISRFNSGITADITAPSLETRIAILEKKAAADGLEVPREVNEYIATNMTTNVREMEGALRRVTAFAGINNQPADLALTQAVLRDLISASDGVEITSSLIMGKTADYFNITMDDLISSSRVRDLAFARQMAMYLCREMTDLSLPKIGELFGGRDHTTVIHAYKKINAEMSEQPSTYNQVSELTSLIKQVAKNS
ncbi:MAG: chromosomal replication initiator protein DnaA [Actinomycetaceae bacterium]|nr:chromosomal replication initiator protein DnaA [Actinomycetaceae bacterium]